MLIPTRPYVKERIETSDCVLQLGAMLTSYGDCITSLQTDTFLPMPMSVTMSVTVTVAVLTSLQTVPLCGSQRRS